MTDGISVKIEIPMKRVMDLLCCAFEGGTTYWARVKARNCPERAPFRVFAADKRPGDGFAHGSLYLAEYPVNGGSLVIEDQFGDGYSGCLDFAALQRGLALMGTQPHARHLADFLAGNDDATTGDVFLQLCLFGELIYG